ncbi:hypothetical protein F53441_12209 [Fusarium austroafricanum]|uniref:DUF6604 domain-containing protein n=1 Tax=Fusarium austroafricanum TaxID=2364996 RepID=A0A8H4K0W4_9HYPO|nr:hypothetical protein F53441_12209 [Fusarium austroafricanum]
MLPGPLLGAYQQYKADTDSVAAWLASTAKACGYPADLLSPDGQKKETGRLKGKARKGAKKQQKPAQNSAPADSARKYIIAIKDFIPLAEYIFASTKPVISVPKALAETIDRVIFMRSKFGSDLIEHGAKLNQDSDATHNYFVGVLQKVRSVLRPRMPVDTPSFDTFDDLSNRFSGLDVYEPSQEFLDAPDYVRPEKAQDDNDTYEAEPQKSFHDAVIAYVVMLNDLNKIRSHIEWIWLNYREGIFDLANAAVATNTGIDLARNLIEQVEPIFEDHGGACDIGQRFSLIVAMREGITPAEFAAWASRGGKDKMYDIADKSFLVANVLMRSSADVLDPRHLPLYKEGMFGTYNPGSDRSKKSGNAKFLEDKIIFAEFFTEAVTVALQVGDYPVEDEFTRGIRELCKTGKVPFYLVFASQILLDIHHTIREQRSSVVKEVLGQIGAMQNELKLHTEFHKDLTIENWPAMNERSLQDFAKSMAWIGRDPVFNAKRKVAQRMGMMADESTRHRILGHSPVIAGLLLYHFRAGMYDLSIAIVNVWGSIAYPTHLYNALQQEGLLVGRWDDMDVVRTLLGDSNLFVGDPPKNKDDYLKRFLLQMGYSASAITTHKGRLLRQPKKHQDMASRAGPRGIKDGAPVSTMFIERYLRGSRQVNLSPEDVDQIISRSKIQEEEGFGTTWGNDNTEEQQTEKKKSRTKQKKKATDGGKLSPGELLEPLVMALTEETPEFAFPYLFLHRLTWKLLRQVKQACDPVLRRMYGATYLDKENQLPFVVGYVLMAFAEDPHLDGKALMRTAAQEMNGLVSQKEVSSLAIKAAAKLYNLHIQIGEDLLDDGGLTLDEEGNLTISM